MAEAPLRVVVAGAGGRTGRPVCEAIRRAGDLSLVGTVGRGDDLAAVLRRTSPHVFVDFTLPECGAEHLHCALDLAVHPVVGTTGLDPERVQAACRKAEESGVGGVVAPNFSVGALLLLELARRAAPHLLEATIIEAHPPSKVDAPSGTALRTQELIAAERGADPREIPIHSIRSSGFVASQEVILGGAGERLTLRHDALDRGCYAPGVLLAIRSAPGLRRLIRDLTPLLLAGDATETGESDPVAGSRRGAPA